MRQRPMRPDPDPLRIACDVSGRTVREGEVMDLGMAVTVYGAAPRPSADHPSAPSLDDPDVTEH